MPTQDDSRFSLNTAYFNVVHALHEALPPATLASPLALRRRMDSAIAMVASLVPVNPAEAMLAANWVGTTMQAMDCQAMAHQPDLPWERKVKCLALANGAQRAAKGLLEQFRQMQAMRVKREGVAPSPDQAAWIEHRVGATMEAALDELQEGLAAESDHDMGQSPVDRSHETDSGSDEPKPSACVEVAKAGSDQKPGYAIDTRRHETNMREGTPPRAPDQAEPVPDGWEHARHERDAIPGSRAAGATVPPPVSALVPPTPPIRSTTGCDRMAEPGSSGAWNPPPFGTPTASPRACPSCADAPN